MANDDQIVKKIMDEFQAFSGMSDIHRASIVERAETMGATIEGLGYTDGSAFFRDLQRIIDIVYMGARVRPVTSKHRKKVVALLADPDYTRRYVKLASALEPSDTGFERLCTALGFAARDGFEPLHCVKMLAAGKEIAALMGGKQDDDSGTIS